MYEVQILDRLVYLMDHLVLFFTKHPGRHGFIACQQEILSVYGRSSTSSLHKTTNGWRAKQLYSEVDYYPACKPHLVFVYSTGTIYAVWFLKGGNYSNNTNKTMSYNIFAE